MQPIQPPPPCPLDPLIPTPSTTTPTSSASPMPSTRRVSRLPPRRLRHDEYAEYDSDHLQPSPPSHIPSTQPPAHPQRQQSRSSSYSSDQSSDPDFLYPDPSPTSAARVVDVARQAKNSLKKRLSFHVRAERTNTLPTPRPAVDFAASPSDPSMSVLARSWVLEGNGSGLRKARRFMEWKKKTAPHKEVKVEANAAGLAPTCLFASDHMLASPFIEPFKETEFITSRPEYIDKQSIVYRDSPFEIAVVGMYISQKKEGKLTNCHQTSVQMACAKRVLLYSLLRESGDVGEDNDALPFIHYDPSKDDKHVSQHANAAPDQFIPIPASKSLFMASDGMQPAAKARRSVNCRFKVLQLDAIDDMLQMCLAGIEQLTSHIGQFSHAAPLLGLLSPALSLASSVSKCALEAHAKPDKVIMTDMNFLLAERARPRLKEDRSSEMAFEHRSGEYLRYGYYFFLQERVDAKLYASFRTFPNVTLMMKRADADTVCGNEKLFFPLTDVSYLVIRVTGRVSGCRATRKAIRMSHVQRLEDVFNTAVAWCDAGGNGADAVNVVRSLATLADDLGISRDQQGTRGDT